ncbi:MAG: DUF2752 domain-containing protein [Firmicutes bacterium]|nr:DUF2752 domain-containing protein [Bacillota bacterium]MCL1953868.1 DUF2752 domain-containing protein [Bacillota bacterium]
MSNLLNTKTKKLVLIAIVVVLMLIVAIYIGFDNPIAFGTCPIRTVTGIHCPGCGATRAAKALIKLDFATTANYHLLFLIISIYLAIAFCYNVYTVIRYNKFIQVKGSHCIAIVIAIVLFTIIRNMNFYPLY